jgi:branched-chain amino acid aminotransferase
LSGITRRTIIDLAPSLGMKVVERRMPIDELLPLIASGRCTEAFACGTAAVISPISMIADQGEEYAFDRERGECTEALYERIVGIQEGRCEDELGWCVDAGAD